MLFSRCWNRAMAQSNRARRIATLLLAGGIAYPTLSAESQRTAASQVRDSAATETWPITKHGDESVPVVFTASGGISLGSYQAGLTWALMRFMRMSNDSLEYRQDKKLPYFNVVALTGASAGNINAIMTAIEWCTPKPASISSWAPESSLFYRTWVNVGWAQLFPDVHDSDENGVLDRKFYRDALYDIIIARRKQATVPTCAGLPLGITITRVMPTTITFGGQIEVPTQRMATVMTFDTVPSTAVSSPQLASSSPPTSLKPLVFRQPPSEFRSPSLGALVAPATGGSVAIPDTSLFTFIEASSAYPIAFGPRTIKTYDAMELQGDGICPHAEPRLVRCAGATSVSYTDGGVFDNNPLALAFELHRLSANTMKRKYKAETFDLRNDSATKITSGSKITGSLGRMAQQEGRSIHDVPLYPPIGIDSLKSHADSLYLPLVAARAIYIDPGILRGTLLARQTHADEPTSIGGLDAVVKLVSGAIPSARKYEMQSLARLMGRDARGHESAIVRPTTRALPLMGEHLGAFGAFFGRPFREYDFYVGIYDGLYYVADEILCAPGRRGPRSQTECRMRELETLADGQAFPTGKYVPYLLQNMMLGETSVSRLADYQDHSAALSREDAEHLEVLRRIASVNVEVLKHPSNDACDTADWAVQLLCNDGIGPLIEKIATPNVRRISREWAKACPSRTTNLDTLGTRCIGDSTFMHVLENPRRFTRSAVWRVGERLLEGERAQRDSSRPNHVTIVKTALVILASMDGPARRGVDWDYAGLPDFVRGWPRALLAPIPEHVSVRVFSPTGGWEVGKRVIVHTGSNMGLSFPYGVSQLRYADRTGGHVNALSVTGGAGVVFKWAGPIFTQLQLAEKWQQRAKLRPDPLREFDDHLSTELAVYGFAGKVRFAVSTLPNVLVSRSRLSATLGLSDLEALAYLLPIRPFK